MTVEEIMKMSDDKTIILTDGKLDYYVKIVSKYRLIQMIIFEVSFPVHNFSGYVSPMKIIYDFTLKQYYFQDISNKKFIESLTIKTKTNETILLEKISEKEIELTNLKKEYEEIKRKNMLDRIVPGNVYRFTYNEETYVRLIREIYEHKVYTRDLIHGSSDSFYIDAIKNVEHLPELTEAYKNFKSLLESA